MCVVFVLVSVRLAVCQQDYPEAAGADVGRANWRGVAWDKEEPVKMMEQIS